MTRNQTTMTLQDLEALLDAFGGQPTRWPADRRHMAEALIEALPEARRMLAEACALDQLLSCAPGADVQRSASLADRIVAAAVDGNGAHERRAHPRAAATRDSQGEGASARVIRLPVRKPPLSAAPRSRPLQPRPVHAAASLWQAAAALAASLLVGVSIGLTDLAPTRALSLASIADRASDADVVLGSLQIDGIAGVLDEDQL
ncbi:MAG: hypothetical protein SFW09_13585 [Hyphomicrobiaceae bacterium]|nr:hypothetical protein [Hyphomicrobiaceae bacterium]